MTYQRPIDEDELAVLWVAAAVQHPAVDGALIPRGEPPLRACKHMNARAQKARAEGTRARGSERETSKRERQRLERERSGREAPERVALGKSGTADPHRSPS